MARTVLVVGLLLGGLPVPRGAAQEAEKKRQVIIRNQDHQQEIVIEKEVEENGKKTTILLKRTGGKDPVDTFDLAVPHPGGDVLTVPGQEGERRLLNTFSLDELPFETRIVKGAPYSAIAITEFTQSLADGNRIQRTTTTQIHRDQEGRTRRELSLTPIASGTVHSEAGQPVQKSVRISDPVAGTSYLLSPETRTAVRTPSLFNFVEGHPLKGASFARVVVGDQLTYFSQTEKGGEGATPPPPPAPPAPPTPPAPPAPPAPPVPTDLPSSFVFESARAGVLLEKEKQNLRQESLGARTIEGVEARGTRTVETIPAGELGNVYPIEIVSERWYSDELQMVLESRHQDPRFGENVYRVTQLSRSEPDAALFQIPADYTVQTPEGRRNIRIERLRTPREGRSPQNEQR